MPQSARSQAPGALGGGPLGWFTTSNMLAGIAVLTAFWFLLTVGYAAATTSLAVSAALAITGASCTKLVYLAWVQDPVEEDGWFTTPRMKAGIVVWTTLIVFAEFGSAEPTTQTLAGVAGYVIGAGLVTAALLGIAKAVYVGASRGASDLWSGAKARL